MFDTSSLLFSLFVVKGTMALILLLFRVTRFRANGLPEMTGAMTLGAVWAFAGIIVVDRSNHVMAIGPLTLICAADMFAARAMRRLQELPFRWRTEVSLLAVCILGIAYFSAIEQSLPLSLAVTSVASATFCGLAAYDLLSEKREGLQTGCRILGGLFGFWALFHLVLVFTRPLYGSGAELVEQIITVDHLVLFLNNILAISWSLGFLWTSYSNAQFRFRAAYEELNRFTGAVAHDLRSPLNAVIGNIEAVTHGGGAAIPETQRRFLDSAHEAALRMNRFINDLLADARSGETGTEVQVADATSCFREAAAGLNAQIEAVAASVQVADLPAVSSNSLQLTRVFHNLLDNAIKYRAQDRDLTIDVSAGRQDGMVHIAFRDNGVGVAKADQARVFERFARAGKQSLVEGDGMGLAECRRIVEKAGGAIALSSDLGDGATFTVSLPAAPE